MNPFSLPRRLTLGFALLLLPPGGLIGQAPATKSSPGEEFAEVVRRYQADHEGVVRFHDLPWSESRMDRIEKLLGDWQQRIKEVNFESLNQPGRIDYLLLSTKIRSEISRLALERRRLTEMDELLSFRKPLQELERSRWMMEPIDSESAATKVSALADQVKKLQKRAEKPKEAKGEKKSTEAEDSKPADKDGGAKSGSPESKAPDKTDSKATDEKPITIQPELARRTAGAVSGIRGTLKAWFSFYDGYQPDFSWWLRKPNEDAGKALEDYAKHLREEVTGLKGKDEDPLIGDALGAEALAEDIAGEFLSYTADELIAIGEKEFAWCEVEMKHDDKLMSMRGNNRHFTRIVTAHELIPGHHLQGFVADRSRDYRSMFSTPFLVEGWALY